MTFVKTGSKPLTVDYIYKENTFGDYFISLTTYEKNFTEQLDFLILAKLKPGVSAEGRTRQAIEPLLKPYPTAKLQDNAQYKADQKQQVNQVLDLIYVLLFLVAVHRVDRHRQHDDLSIHERTHELGLLRAVGESRRQIRSMIRWEAVIISLLGTMLGIVIASVLRMGVVHGAEGRGVLQVRGRARAAARRDRRARRLLGVLAAILPARACGEARHPATRSRTSSRRGQRVGVNRSRTVASFSRTMLREVGLVPLHLRRGASRRCAARMRTASRPALRGVADRDRGDRDARRASARSTAASRGRRGARAVPARRSPGSGVIDAVMPGRWAAPPAPAMITRRPRSAAVRAYSTMTSGVRCAETMRTSCAHAELGEHVDRAPASRAGRSRCP